MPSTYPLTLEMSQFIKSIVFAGGVVTAAPAFFSAINGFIVIGRRSGPVTRFSDGGLDIDL